MEIGKRVVQARCDAPEFQRFVGRRGAVQETLVDEKGNLHARTDDGVWCPARLLDEDPCQ